MQTQRTFPHLLDAPRIAAVRDDETPNVSIDLRDASVAEGLADLLSRFTDLTERAAVAEARADQEHEAKLQAAGQARAAASDLEFERAELHRATVDNAALRRELEVRQQQLEHSMGEAEWCRRRIEDLSVSHQCQTKELQDELQELRRTHNQLQSLVSARKKILFQRTQEGETTTFCDYLLAPYRKV